MERDPIGYDDGMNPYEFVGSNPLLYTDPYGLQKKIPWNDYFDQFKKDHPDLTPEQLKWVERQLARGCVGVTCANLGRTNPNNKCFKTRAQAEEALKKEKCKDGCGLYSIHLWSDPKDPAVTFDPKTGEADLSKWTREGRPPGDWNRGSWRDWDGDGKPDPTTGVNFDYGFVGPDGTIWHADMYHNPDRDGDGKGDYYPKNPIRDATIYGSDDKEWAASYPDFNTEVWCVACKGDYK
jgi:hypothetical protein